ncbi:MAG: hypothetical protein A2X92_03130 [Syntrophus sp. GWC2_56_31]|nr:MAG: hypothetical protein A2X92_03130 [Syntrophus sp. GWC2_56_31]
MIAVSAGGFRSRIDTRYGAGRVQPINLLILMKIPDALFGGCFRMIQPGDFMIERFQFFYEATIVTAFTFVSWSVVHRFHLFMIYYPVLK